MKKKGYFFLRLWHSLIIFWNFMVLDETQFQWQTIARSNQKVPLGNWRVWLIMAGRGFGKTRTGAETIREWVSSGMYGRIALIGETIREARDIMVEGVSMGQTQRAQFASAMKKNDDDMAKFLDELRSRVTIADSGT